MDVLGFATLSVTGFAACAESGSYAFVHPVIRRLPRDHHVTVEKGLLRTFGRVMPVLMTLCVVLSIVPCGARSSRERPALAFSCGLYARLGIDFDLQRAVQPRHRPVGPRQSA